MADESESSKIGRKDFFKLAGLGAGAAITGGMTAVKSPEVPISETDLWKGTEISSIRQVEDVPKGKQVKIGLSSLSRIVFDQDWFSKNPNEWGEQVNYALIGSPDEKKLQLGPNIGFIFSILYTYDDAHFREIELTLDEENKIPTLITEKGEIRPYTFVAASGRKNGHADGEQVERKHIVIGKPITSEPLGPNDLMKDAISS